MSNEILHTKTIPNISTNEIKHYQPRIPQIKLWYQKTQETNKTLLKNALIVQVI